MNKKFFLVIGMAILSVTQILAYNFQVDGIYYMILSNSTDVVVTSGNSYSGGIIIPDTVEYYGQKYNVIGIGFKAFYNCKNLSSITIPKNVIWIADDAFSNCSGLSQVYFNGSIQQWVNIDNLKSLMLNFQYKSYYLIIDNHLITESDLILPDGIKVISPYAFYNCYLNSVTLPQSVELIGEEAFYKYNSGYSTTISYISFAGSLKQWLEINGIKELMKYRITGENGGKLYIDNKLLEGEITIPKSINNVPDYAFYGCSGLTSVSIPNNVTIIGNYAFEKCRKIRTIDMGAGVESIGSMAFAYCPYISEITVRAEYPPVCEYYTEYNLKYGPFQGCGIEDANEKETYTNINLYVMKSSMSMYQKTAVWKDFNIRPIAAQSTYTDKVTVTPYTNSADISWPAIDNADTYNLTISRNGNMVCQHQFNESGQLMSVVYRMPGAANDAQQTETLGFQYTITDLASGTNYDYNILVQDMTQKTIKTYTGSFTTEGTTALEYVRYEGNITELVSQPSTEIFNLQGMNVSNMRNNLPNGTYIVRNAGNVYKILINK